ncbi:hypothetical protein [Kitasatospora sp. NPDC050543]|uniref:hypothetical protein n=1 Tax=Kitasatospora sp. NPDC050543 TaxID=3364054 RepID=UPI003795D5C1
MRGASVAGGRAVSTGAPAAVPAPAVRQVTAGIDGVMPAASFKGAPEAVGALLEVVRILPLSVQHRQFVEGCLAGGLALEVITRRLERVGEFSLMVRLVDVKGDTPRWVEHPLRITVVGR